MRLLVAVLLLRAHNPQLLYAGNENAHIAANLAAARGFSAPYANAPIAPTAQQPPLYPILLAAIFKLEGSFTLTSLAIALAVNCLAGALTAVLILRAGQQYFPPGVGLVAGWLWAVWPYEALVAMPLANYALSALFAMAWLLYVPNLLRSERKRPWVAAGAFAGAGLLLNPSLGVLPVASIPWMHSRRGLPVRIVLAMATCVLVVVPWTLRNYRTLHRLIPVRDNFGLELFLGNRPGMSGTVDFTEDFPTLDARRYAELGEVRFMDEKQEQALAFIREQPLQFLARLVRRIFAFWTAPVPYWWAILSALSWWGAVLALRQPREREVGVFLLLIFLLMPAVYYLTHFWPTYRHPIEPLMLLAAGNALVPIVGERPGAPSLAYFAKGGIPR